MNEATFERLFAQACAMIGVERFDAAHYLFEHRGVSMMVFPDRHVEGGTVLIIDIGQIPSERELEIYRWMAEVNLVEGGGAFGLLGVQSDIGRALRHVNLAPCGPFELARSLNMLVEQTLEWRQDCGLTAEDGLLNDGSLPGYRMPGAAIDFSSFAVTVDDAGLSNGEPVSQSTWSEILGALRKFYQKPLSQPEDTNRLVVPCAGRSVVISGDDARETYDIWAYAGDLSPAQEHRVLETLLGMSALTNGHDHVVVGVRQGSNRLIVRRTMPVALDPYADSAIQAIEHVAGQANLWRCLLDDVCDVELLQVV